MVRQRRVEEADEMLTNLSELLGARIRAINRHGKLQAALHSDGSLFRENSVGKLDF